MVWPKTRGPPLGLDAMAGSGGVVFLVLCRKILSQFARAFLGKCALSIEHCLK